MGSTLHARSRIRSVAALQDLHLQFRKTVASAQCLWMIDIISHASLRVITNSKALLHCELVFWMGCFPFEGAVIGTLSYLRHYSNCCHFIFAPWLKRKCWSVFTLLSRLLWTGLWGLGHPQILYVLSIDIFADGSEKLLNVSVCWELSQLLLDSPIRWTARPTFSLSAPPAYNGLCSAHIH